MTEDVLSAIKVSRVPKNIGVAILGSSLKEDQAVKIAREAENVAIFFDNDNGQVRANQQKARKAIAPMVRGQCRIIYGDRDPKEYTIRELSELLED